MNLKSIIKLCFGLALLGGLLSAADGGAVLRMGDSLHSGYAVAGMLVFLTTSALDMWRLRLASPAAQAMPKGRFVRMHVESYIMAQLLPGHLGMDAYRVAMIGRAGHGYAEPAIVLFALRVFSLLLMLLGTAMLIAVLPQWQALYLPWLHVLAVQPSWVMAGAGLGLTAGILLPLWLLRRLWQRFRHRLEAVVTAYKALTPALVAGLVMVTLLMLASRIATFLLTLAAFGIEMEIGLATTIALLAALSWLLPLSPAGIGIREGVITGLLVWLGEDYTLALMVALLNRLYFVALAGCGGISFLLPKNNAPLAEERP